MALDRTGRESIETSYVLKQITDAGVRVLCYSDGHEIKLDRPIDKAMLGLQGFAAEDFRFQIKNKTTEALLAKFERGYATGGAPLGYKLIPARDGSNNKELAIIPEEASIVECIFTLMADGKGLRRTRTALNDASIVNPRGKPWSLSNLREIIHRDLYRGEAIYGKTVRAYTYGTSEKSRTDASQWHRKTLEHLRIVPEPLWQRAQARLQQTRAAYVRDSAGQLGGKPESGIESTYLLSGFLICGACGGKLRAVHRTGKRFAGRTVVSYECWNYRDKGPSVCGMKSRLPVDEIDQGVIHALSDGVLTPELLEQVLQFGFEKASQQTGGAAEERERVLRELAKVEGELRKLTDALAAGAAVASVLDAIKARESAKRDLQARLEHLDGISKAAEHQAWTLEQVREIAQNWNGFLHLAPAIGRQYLRRIVTGPVTVHKTATGWSFAFAGFLGALFEGVIEYVYAPEETCNERAVPVL
jgi:site-specific DNA recombinase